VEFVLGELERNQIVKSKSDSFKEENIEILAGKRVVDLKPSENVVILDDNSSLDYSFLLVATGARSLLHPSLEEFSKHITVLNDLRDAEYLKNEIRNLKSALVLGTGFIGLEMVRALCKLGIHVTYFTDEGKMWDLDIQGLTFDVVRRKLEENNVDLMMALDLLSVKKTDAGNYKVLFSSEQEVECQLIVSAWDRAPNIDFLEGSGMNIDEGILVTEGLRTSVPNVFAAGDCAQVRSLKDGTSRINFGMLSAGRQGEIAGKNMAGREDFYIQSSKEEFFLELYGKRLLERW